MVYKGIYHFYGHIHNSESGAANVMSLYKKAVNVGIDTIGKPKTAEELINERAKAFEKQSRVTMEQLLRDINNPVMR